MLEYVTVKPRIILVVIGAWPFVGIRGLVWEYVTVNPRIILVVQEHWCVAIRGHPGLVW